MATVEHRSTARVLDILELLSKNTEGYGLSEMAMLIDAPKSSLSPIIHTMLERGFISFNPLLSKYTIGYASYFVGCAYESQHPVYDLICKIMESIVTEAAETCHLGILSNSNVLYIAKQEAQNPIMLKSHIGIQLPAYCTGIGKALIYQFTSEELRALYPEGLQSYTENTITSFEDLEKELKEVARTGFAYENSELTQDVACIAVPLRSKGYTIASLSISMPVFRATPEAMSKMKVLLASAQETIEHYFVTLNITDTSGLI